MTLEGLKVSPESFYGRVRRAIERELGELLACYSALPIVTYHYPPHYERVYGPSDVVVTVLELNADGTTRRLYVLPTVEGLATCTRRTLERMQYGRPEEPASIELSLRFDRPAVYPP